MFSNVYTNSSILNNLTQALLVLKSIAFPCLYTYQLLVISGALSCFQLIPCHCSSSHYHHLSFFSQPQLSTLFPQYRVPSRRRYVRTAEPRPTYCFILDHGLVRRKKLFMMVCCVVFFIFAFLLSYPFIFATGVAMGPYGHAMLYSNVSRPMIPF